MRSHTGWIIFALFVAEMTVTFESSMVYAALPTLIRDFGDPLTAGWLVTAHLLIAAATAPVFGRLGDIRGRKLMIVALLGIALVGSLMSALSSNFGVVLAGRALQGMSAAVLPLSIGVLRESLPPGKVPLAIGLMTTSQGFGAATGLVLGGVIVDQLDWHWLFGASALLLAISMIAVLAFVPSRPGTPTRNPIDWIEGALPVPAISAILFGISASKSFGFVSLQSLGLIVVGLLLMLYWGRRSLRSPEPFIDLRLFSERNFAVSNAMQILLGMGTMQILYVFSNYMQSPAWTLVGLGLTATVAGMAKLPSNALSFFAGPLSGWMTTRYGDRLTVMSGAALATLGWVAALILPDTLTKVIVILCIISFGTTILQAAIPNVVVAAVPANRTSEAIGTMSVVRGIAAALGAQMIAMLLASQTIAQPGGGALFPTADAYRLTMLVMAGLTFGGVLCALLLRRRDHGASRIVPEAAGVEAT